MELSDIKRYFITGASRTVTIYCELCTKYTGYVETVTIISEQQVRIEFDVYGYDEAGITYYIEYDKFETLIKSLQEYLGKSSDQWNIINQTGYYPDEPQMEYHINQTHVLIESDFLNDTIILPKNGKVTIKDDYWKKLYDENKMKVGFKPQV